MPEPLPPPSPASEPSPPPAALPWEAAGAGIKEFFLTMYGIMARPSWVLAAPPAGAWTRWTGFALIMWFLVFLARYLLSWAWSMGAMGGLAVLVWTMVGMVVQAIIFLPLYSGAVQLTLNLLNREQGGPPFPLVLRAVCYSQVSTAAMVLPVVGLLVHLVWNVVVLAIALQVGLGQSRRNAYLGVILPMVGFFVLGLPLAGMGLRLH